MRGVWDVLGALGFSRDIAGAIARAEVEPTSANLRRVVSAYAANGQTPPPKLMAHLVALNKQYYPEDSFIVETVEAAAPWIAVGALVFMFLILRRKR